MSERLVALGINKAISDGDKAVFLSAVITFAKSIHDDALVVEAGALMPAANPFRPPQAWREQYNDGFSSTADEERGTYLADMPRYGVEYWQGLTDMQRQERLQNPELGFDDGQKDANALNSVEL